jgi:inner membrane protein
MFLVILPKKAFLNYLSFSMTFPSVRYSIGLRMIVIAALTLLMLVPVSFVESLIDERAARRDEATKEISEKWGGKQVVSGPVVSIPYKTFVRQERTNDKGVVSYTMEEITDFLHILPERLAVTTKLTPEIRYRGIYQIILYRSTIHLEGSFLLASVVNDFAISPDKILWNDATVSLGIADLKGIKDAIFVQWNGASVAANPGLNSNQVLEQGISIRPVLNGVEKADFSVDINLNGSTELMFVPVGRETSVSVAAPWANPSFVGAYLPEKREVKPNEFAATWKILHLNRNYPQAWTGNAYRIGESMFGTRLLSAIDEYQKTTRTAKYAIMFIALTFLSFFMAEVLTGRVIHPIQYVLIGLALVIFYTLLLSISEQVPFNAAYIVSSVAVILLITGYTRSVLANMRATLIILGILTILYGFLFVILQLQDYALLLGSIGLFIILAVVMYLTRTIDWFGIGKNGGSADKISSQAVEK